MLTTISIIMCVIGLFCIGLAVIIKRPYFIKRIRNNMFFNSKPGTEVTVSVESDKSIYELKFVQIPQADVISVKCALMQDMDPMHSIYSVRRKEDKDIYVLTNVTSAVRCLLVDAEDISIYFQLFSEQFFDSAVEKTIQYTDKLTLTLNEGKEDECQEYFDAIAEVGTILADFSFRFKYAVYYNKERDAYCLTIVDKQKHMMYMYAGVPVEGVEYL